MKPKLSDQEKPSEDLETQPSILIPKLSDHEEKPDEELQSQLTWKPKVDAWSILPIFIFSSIFCSLYELDRTFFISRESICSNREPGGINMHLEGQEVFLLLLIPILPPLLTSYIDNEKLNKFYRSFFSNLGTFFIFVVIAVSGWRTLSEVIFKGPFVSCELRANEDLGELLQQGSFDLGGLICVIGMMTVILDGFPWVKHKEDEKDDFLTQNLKKYSKSIVKYHVTIVLLSFATIFANIVYEIIYTFIDNYYETQTFMIYEYNPDRLIWILTFLAFSTIELFKLHSYKKKNSRDEENICDDATV